MIENIKATAVTYVGNCFELHGPSGQCTCCHGRQLAAHVPLAPTKAAVLGAVSDAAPNEVKARIDKAILAVAARGGVFSANDFRDRFPESGGIVGSRVATLARQRGWEHVGYVASSKPNTHGHEIKTWRIRSAVAA